MIFTRPNFVFAGMTLRIWHLQVHRLIPHHEYLSPHVWRPDLQLTCSALGRGLTLPRLRPRVSITIDRLTIIWMGGLAVASRHRHTYCASRSLLAATVIPGLSSSPIPLTMRLALYFRFFGGFASLSFVSGLRNVTLDDNDPAIVYSVGWNESTANNPLDFGGSLHFSNNSTASASVTFRGE
jgi:hypothetical protein